MRIVVLLFALFQGVKGGNLDLSTLLSSLAEADVNRATTAQVVLEYQNMASHTDFSHDNAKDPLFKISDDSFLTSQPTYSNMLAIADSFIRDASLPDPVSSERTALWNALFRALNTTTVFRSGWTSLAQQGLVSASYDDFQSQMFALWMQPFARKTEMGSSGFEATFIGEFLDDKVIGLSNWIRFYELEKAGQIDYHGWFDRQKDIQLSLQFALTDNGKVKQAMISPLLVDSSPEFDIIAYTICLLAAQGQCSYTFAGNTINLFVETATVDGGAVTITNAYPSIGSTAAVTTTKKTPTDNAALQSLVDSMRAADSDKASSSQYKVNWGSKISGSSSTCSTSNKLITNVDESLFTRTVYSVLQTVYDNNMLVPDVCVNETDYNTGFKRSAFQAILDAWADTKVFPLMHSYLVNAGKADADLTKFKQFLYQFWFGPYTRCTSNKKIWGSSGFEHVFSGEWKSGEVDGQHNWMKYYRVQQAGDISYCGYFHYDGQLTGTFKYDWKTEKKNEGGFLIGTSPVFDFSLFTTCALTAQGAKACRFTIDGFSLAVTAYTQACGNSGTCLSTSYPVDEL